MSKERFVLQPSKEMQDGWVATDTENGIVLRFENHKLEQTLRCTPLLTDGRDKRLGILGRPGRMDVQGVRREGSERSCYRQTA